MDYALAYNRLIAKARQRVAIDGYVERHHILPKALGGTDDSSNLVALTGRGSSRSFAEARRKLSSLMTGNTKTLGRKASEEEREYLSSIRKGKPGRKLTEEEKKHLSAINMGKSLSQEHKEKLSIAQKGIPKPDGFGAKVAATLKGKPRSQETKDKLSRYYAALRESKRLLADASIRSQSKELS